LHLLQEGIHISQSLYPSYHCLQIRILIPLDFTVTPCVHLSVGNRFFRQFIAFFATHQMAMALFRFLGAILKTMVVANTFGMFVMLIVFIFGGFVIPRSK
jgi:ABC-type multidrug transport system permease subunit